MAAALAANKYFLRKMLKKEGVPVPRTLILRSPNMWRSVLESSLSFPLVVKPITASHASGASFNLVGASELHRAVTRAFTHNEKTRKGDRVLVEEFFSGNDLRFLVIGGKVVSVILREPAYVTGDGKRTVRELIHAFNEDWFSPIKYDLPLCPIPIDREVFRCLARTGLTLESVVPVGETVPVRWNANVSTGGRSIEVTHQVHPRLKALAVKIAKISHLSISGVDILCKDITSGDCSAANISVLEINDSPGRDIHHFPFEGIGKDVSSDILDYIFGKPVREEEVDLQQIESLLIDIHARHSALAKELQSTR